MSNASSRVPWNPWLGAGFTVFLFIAAQIIAATAISLSAHLFGSNGPAVQDSLTVQIVYLVLTAILLIIPLRWFLKAHKCDFSAIGLRRPKRTDPLYSLSALPVYVILFVFVTAAVKYFAPGLNVEQAQDLGFNGVYGGGQLALIALGLVVLPPLTEEIIFRGMLYGSLKKAMPIAGAAVLTSLIFAGGHLLEGGGGGPLYIAGIDTFVLSLVLVYLREKTGGLWASIGLHALKNGIAFVALFVLHAH